MHGKTATRVTAVRPAAWRPAIDANERRRWLVRQNILEETRIDSLPDATQFELYAIRAEFRAGHRENGLLQKDHNFRPSTLDAARTLHLIQF